jgi:hypothetical protein
MVELGPFSIEVGSFLNPRGTYQQQRRAALIVGWYTSFPESSISWAILPINFASCPKPSSGTEKVVSDVSSPYVRHISES